MENINYEVFYQDIRQKEKTFGDKLQQAQRCFKNIIRGSERGDTKKLTKDIEDLRSFMSELTVLSNELQDTANGFDSEAYFGSGEFTRQMIDYCKQHGVDIKGEAGVYELFPFKVRIDAENQDMYVNRKKVHCTRPLQFVQDMKQQIEKYTKSSFNLAQFINELAAAYDIAVMVKNNKSSASRLDPDMLLKNIYGYLAPTQKARREYDMQQYAFDLSRLNAAGLEEATRDGRKIQFGTGKHEKDQIRMLNSDGAEQYWATIRFYIPK